MIKNCHSVIELCNDFFFGRSPIATLFFNAKITKKLDFKSTKVQGTALHVLTTPFFINKRLMRLYCISFYHAGGPCIPDHEFWHFFEYSKFLCF